MTITPNVEPTLARLAEQYLASARFRELRPTSQRESRRVLLKEVLPRIGHLPAEQISRKDIATRLLIELEDRPGIARNAYSATSAVFIWGMKRGIVDDNPASKIAPPKPKPRDRLLNHDEIRLIWNECPKLGDYGRIFRLLLLTGCRRQELAGLTWMEVNRPERRIELPKERVKLNRARNVHLTDLALAQLPPWREGWEHVFGKGWDGFKGWSGGETKLAKSVLLVPRFGLHDLRRTIATNMARLGVPLHISEKILDHKSGSFAGVVGTYQLYRYEAEMREALEAWSAEVARIVGEL